MIYCLRAEIWRFSSSRIAEKNKVQSSLRNECVGDVRTCTNIVIDKTTFFHGRNRMLRRKFVLMDTRVTTGPTGAIALNKNRTEDEIIFKPHHKIHRCLGMIQVLNDSTAILTVYYFEDSF